MKRMQQWKNSNLAAALLLALLLSGCGAPQQSGVSSSLPDEIVSQPAQVELEEVELGNGLSLTDLSAASGTFPEDGSDVSVSNVLCATFFNSSASTLQYAKVKATLNGVDYSFEISTIPPGKTVHAFDLEKKAAPEAIESLSTAAEYVVFFPEEPTTDDERLQISFADSTITVKNISDENIDQEIFVYYKTVVDGVYMGGITYRVPVGMLATGQEVVGYSSHAGSNSELMFVTYGN